MRAAAPLLCAAGLLGCLVSCMTPTGQPPLSNPSPSTAERGAGIPAAADGPFPVDHVVDGDTLWVRRDGKNVKVRLIGIDTPETVDPRRPVQCFGKEASARAKALLTGARVLLIGDPTQDRSDRYGRELDYLWLADGRFFNLLMIRQGLAHEYTYDLPYRYQRSFRAAQRWAELRGRGLWATTTCRGGTTGDSGEQRSAR